MKNKEIANFHSTFTADDYIYVSKNLHDQDITEAKSLKNDYQHIKEQEQTEQNEEIKISTLSNKEKEQKLKTEF